MTDSMGRNAHGYRVTPEGTCSTADLAHLISRRERDISYHDIHRILNSLHQLDAVIVSRPFQSASLDMRRGLDGVRKSFSRERDDRKFEEEIDQSVFSPLPGVYVKKMGDD